MSSKSRSKVFQTLSRTKSRRDVRFRCFAGREQKILFSETAYGFRKFLRQATRFLCTNNIFPTCPQLTIHFFQEKKTAINILTLMTYLQITLVLYFKGCWTVTKIFMLAVYIFQVTGVNTFLFLPVCCVYRKIQSNLSIELVHRQLLGDPSEDHVLGFS